MIKNLKSRGDFSKCLELADVYLDALGDTEWVSVVESILVGVPPVIRYSETSRGRQIAALLKELELPELIVHIEKEYINLNFSVKNHKNWYSYSRNVIQEKGMPATGVRCSHCSRNQNNDNTWPLQCTTTQKLTLLIGGIHNV